MKAKLSVCRRVRWLKHAAILRQLPAWLLVACLGCGTTARSSSTQRDSCDTIAEPSLGSCSGCDACPDGLEFVACDASQPLGCVCEAPSPVNKDEYDSLACCPLESPCPPASFESAGPLAGSWTNQECLFTALAERTPGRYMFTNRFCDIGCIEAHTLLVVPPEGDVLVSGSVASQSTKTPRAHLPRRPHRAPTGLSNVVRSPQGSFSIAVSTTRRCPSTWAIPAPRAANGSSIVEPPLRNARGDAVTPRLGT